MKLQYLHDKFSDEEFKSVVSISNSFSNELCFVNVSNLLFANIDFEGISNIRIKPDVANIEPNKNGGPGNIRFKNTFNLINLLKETAIQDPPNPKFYSSF